VPYPQHFFQEKCSAREALGTLLIIAAALFEVLGKKPKNATQF